MADKKDTPKQQARKISGLVRRLGEMDADISRTKKSLDNKNDKRNKVLLELKKLNQELAASFQSEILKPTPAKSVAKKD